MTYEKPNSQRVLELLKEAGDEGIQGPDIARHFTIPDPDFNPDGHMKTVAQANLQRRLTWTNQILDRFRKRGYAERIAKEPSHHYHQVPAWRWRITERGVQYLSNGMAAGERRMRYEAHKQRMAELTSHRRKCDDLITQAYVTYDPATIYKCERETAIKELRGQGCTLDAIGGVFGLTRERVRQILMGYRTGKCRCPNCTPGWVPVND